MKDCSEHANEQGHCADHPRPYHPILRTKKPRQRNVLQVPRPGAQGSLTLQGRRAELLAPGWGCPGAPMKPSSPRGLALSDEQGLMASGLTRHPSPPPPHHRDMDSRPCAPPGRLVFQTLPVLSLERAWSQVLGRVCVWGVIMCVCWG